MPTPGFVPQDANSLTQVRYYTALDPYYYAVDNRPLQDLAANIEKISSGGGDSARRAVLLTQLSMSSVFQELFSTPNPKGFISGLTVAYPGSNIVQVNPGSLYQTQVLNASDGRPIIKQALNLAAKQFSIVQPSVGGEAISYLIQGRYRDLTSDQQTSSGLPFLDPNNEFLPCLLLNGELELGIKNGTAAPEGSQTIPTPDPDWIPLYVVTAVFGQANPTITLAENSPSMKGLYRDVILGNRTTEAAAGTPVAGINTLTLEKTGIQGVTLSIPLNNSAISDGTFPNPYAPIKFKLVYSSNESGGNFALRLQYRALSVGDSTEGTPVSTLLEAVPMDVAANSIAAYHTITMVIPPTAFSGILGGVWTVTKQKLYVTLQRIPGDVADTAAGDFYLHDVIAYQ